MASFTQSSNGFVSANDIVIPHMEAWKEVYMKRAFMYICDKNRTKDDFVKLLSYLLPNVSSMEVVAFWNKNKNIIDK